MAKKTEDTSLRDKAQPTGNMSAEESHQYAREFQKENFGDAINIGGGRAEGSDAVGTTQKTFQNAEGIPHQFDDRSDLDHKANYPNEHSDKKDT